jgi:hypothetical protein
MTRKAGNAAIRCEAGTDLALAQLQAHCDSLNELSGGRDGWHVIGRVGSRTVARRTDRAA